MTLHNIAVLSTTHKLDFAQPLPPKILNIEGKYRSNLLTWRGQFSPQLVEALLMAYCPENSVVLDPFSGSGTVIFEAACFGFTSYGVELNPSAWILSRIYQLVNYEYEKRDNLLNSVYKILSLRWPEPDILYTNNKVIDIDEFRVDVAYMVRQLSDSERIVFDGFVILLDIANNSITSKHIHSTFDKLSNLIRRLPLLRSPVRALLSDARSVPLKSRSVDFVLTSPPYINVFNYHQNYRRSAEMLDWDLLKIARSEIGSNRANRGNRFLTVVQYCLDMYSVIKEISRVIKKDGRAILVVGYESRVLGVPFYNADLLESIACSSGLFCISQRQKREFRNKFGTVIREDLLHLKANEDAKIDDKTCVMQARAIAHKVLTSSLSIVSVSNAELLREAISRVEDAEGTPFYRNSTSEY